MNIFSINLNDLHPLRGLKFLNEVKEYHACPSPLAYEIAIIGRSNAGKSSLINSLAGEKRLAKVSSTPGRTQSLVFFGWQGIAQTLVDLPGYGYAKTSKANQKSWRWLIEKYLLERVNLRALVLVMDCRRSISEDELVLIRFAAARALAVMVVLSKADKLSRSKLALHKKAIATSLSAYVAAGMEIKVIAHSILKDKNPTANNGVGYWIVQQLALVTDSDTNSLVE